MKKSDTKVITKNKGKFPDGSNFSIITKDREKNSVVETIEKTDVFSQKVEISFKVFIN